MREVRGEPNDGWYNQPGEERLKRASSHLLPNHLLTPVTQITFFGRIPHKKWRHFFTWLRFAGPPSPHDQRNPTSVSGALASDTSRPPSPTCSTRPPPRPPRPPSSTCSARPAPPPRTSCAAAPATAHSWTLSGQTTFFIPTNKQSTIIFTLSQK